jgi:hypothetical protein
MLMSQAWQGAVLAVALLWLVGLRRSPTLMLLGAGVLGAVLSGVVPV